MAIEKLKKALRGRLRENGSIPFWSWNNALCEDELVKQIEDMHAAGIGGFIMHARTGLKDEYLSEKWFSCVGACLKKAKALKMNAWVYDENGWPSGFVGGKLLENEDYRARFLTYKQTDFFDNDAFVVYVQTENGYSRVDGCVEGAREYHCIYLTVSPANTDILKPEVVDAFIRETHEQYYERFKDSFGKELVGFFTDEPQYYRRATPYSDEAAKAFAAKGEDVKDGLIWLFKHDERGYAFRTEYFRTLNTLYVENFYKKLYDWCEAHHCKLTGHSIEEGALHNQMLGGAGVMPTYEYEHIPAIDWLGRCCGTELAPKQVSSAAAQLGKKYVLTETFACGGYDTTPKELKSIGDFQYFNGVNMMCQHLYPYSIAAQGKFDHPPFFSPHSNWFREFKAFNEYFNRLGCIVANTEERYDVAIVHPLRNVYLNYVWAEGWESVKALESAFKVLMDTLRRSGVTYHLLDERLLERYGKIEGGALVVGRCKYDTIIVPKMDSMAASTYALLKKYTGKLYLEHKPEMLDGKRSEINLTPNTTLEEIVDSAAIRFRCDDGNCSLSSRAGELGDFLFIKNYSLTEASEVRLFGVAEKYKQLDLETLETHNISPLLRLEQSEGIILIKDETAKPETSRYIETDITSQFCLADIGDNYFVLDYVSVSYDGKTFGEYLPLQQVFEQLLRENYKGKLFVKQCFTVRSLFKARLMIEKAKYTALTLNGTPLNLEQSAFDINFAEAEIGDKLQIGENELVYSFDYYQHEGVHFTLFHPLATESLKNCLYYDTSLENAYIKGDFVVGEDMSLSMRAGLPQMNSDLYKNGYPFFMGTLTLKGVIKGKRAKSTLLCLDGRFLVANVFINGTAVDFITDTQKDISAYLTQDENEVVIKVKSSLRNLFGPHHYAPDPDPMGVAPHNFTLRGSWKDGTSPLYTAKYNCVPFGIDTIRLKERR